MSASNLRKPVSREFRLLAACMGWPQTAETSLRVQGLVAADIDWEAFVSLTARHRVAALAQAGLHKAGVTAPAEPAQRLAYAARQEAIKELALAGEVLRVNAALQTHAMKPVLLKGVGIALRGFGRLGMRNNRDIDILVAAGEVAGCGKVLKSLGYSRIEPAETADDRAIAHWMDLHKDMVFLNRESSTIIEVHWRLFDNPHMMSLGDLKADTISYGGREIAVLPITTNIIYLCAHGAQHAWSRLKWLVDLSVSLTQLSDAQFEDLRIEAEQRGLQPLLSSSVRLCVDILNTPLPQGFLKSIGGDWRVDVLQRIAQASLIHGGAVELEDRPWGSTLKNISHYLFKSDLHYWISEIHYDYVDGEQVGDDGSWRHNLHRVPRWIIKHAHLRAQEKTRHNNLAS